MKHVIQISADGRTLWVHTSDGSTIGRFSKRFGMDVHTAASEQLAGAGQCLACTHTPPSSEDWKTFISLMSRHYGVTVPANAMSFV
jgi:hypothetical protein